MEILKKVYGIYGIVEYSALINKQLRVYFSGGSVSGSGVTPATYATDNLAAQYSIEKSEMFSKGRIKIVAEYKTGKFIKEPTISPKVENKDGENNEPKKEGENEGEKKGESNDNANAVDFPDVTNSQMAKSILMNEPYNVALVELPNKSAIVNKATELHVTFSNWK